MTMPNTQWQCLTPNKLTNATKDKKVSFWLYKGSTEAWQSLNNGTTKASTRVLFLKVEFSSFFPFSGHFCHGTAMGAARAAAVGPSSSAGSTNFGCPDWRLSAMPSWVNLLGIYLLWNRAGDSLFSHWARVLLLYAPKKMFQLWLRGPVTFSFLINDQFD